MANLDGLISSGGNLNGSLGAGPIIMNPFVITITEIDGGHRFSVAKGNSVQTMDVLDGTDGADGTDGYSPTVSVTEITGGHRVTITDAAGPHVFDVMDGQGGGGSPSFDDLNNRPKYNGAEMTHSTNIPEVKTSTWDAKQEQIIAGTNITISQDGKTINSSGGGGNLEDHPIEENAGIIEHGTMATIDSTLTQSGKAADAKAVGDKLSEQSSAIENIRTSKENAHGHPYALDGANLKDVFGTAAALHAAIAAGDFSLIHVGDYYPITLTGNYRDYGVGSAAGEYEQKSFSNATVILEVAAINPYWRYGDSGNIAGGTPHVLFISRDCLPATLKMRKANDLWEDETSKNPWLGSALYRTLNDPDYGIVNMVEDTDIGAYLYGGADGNGMRYFGEKRDPITSSTSTVAWFSRGKLFLPTEDEIWGREIFTIRSYHGMKGLPIFDGTRRRILKGIGDGGSLDGWASMSASNGSTGVFCYVSSKGYPDASSTNRSFGAPLCFLVT